MKPLPQLQIGKYTAQYPIIQGAMAVQVSGANLAGAVANTGCIGTISSFGLGLNYPYFYNYQKPHKPRQFFIANQLALIEQLQQARSISPNGIIGVNVLVAMRDYPDIVKTAIEHGANLLVVGAGIPLDLPEYTHNYPDIALVPMISTVTNAKIICEHWERYYNRLPDAFVVGCPKNSGGHLGVKDEAVGDPVCSLEQLIPDLLEYLDQLGVNIPVIASGGIGNRADIDAMLALGASGVQIGTRFILTHECDADPVYKEFHLHTKRDDLVLMPSPVGVSGRAIRNKFTQRVSMRSPQNKQKCIANCLKVCAYRDHQETYCLLQALNCAARGDVENGLVFSGAHIEQAQAIVSVAELVAELTYTDIAVSLVGRVKAV